MKNLICAVTVLAVSTAQADTIYVDENAPLGGDGLSWQTAYHFLQDGLADAAASAGAVTDIRVAQGTYKPDQDEAGSVTPNDREASFQLVSAVDLLGGYVGPGSPDPDQRDVQLFETLLSGDLLGDDNSDFANNQDNSFHVVTAAGVSDAFLEGFTVTAGNAQGDSFFSQGGGGMFADNSTLAIARCVFRGNSADQNAGAMFLNVTPLNVSDCIFEGNRSLGQAGAGGGAIVGFDSDMVFVACDVHDNTAENLAGGIASVAFDAPSQLMLINCSISGNTAGLIGGGLFSQSSNATVIGCIIDDNAALHEEFGAGGGVVLIGSQPSLVIINTQIHGNFAQVRGAGISARNSVAIINCTISRNEAGAFAGGLDAPVDTIGSVQNSIFWENTAAGVSDEPAQLLVDLGAEVSVDFSCVQGLTGDLGGIGNIDADPLFVDPNNGDYRLSAGSPAIDAGNNWGVLPDFVDLDADGDTAELTPFDLDSNLRFADDPATTDTGCGIPVAVDMGAFEFQGVAAPNPIYLGDLDADRVVGIVDFLALLANWGLCEPGCCLADLDIDGNVGITDFLLLLANWG